MASRALAIRDAIVTFLRAYPFQETFDVLPSVLLPAELDELAVRRLYVWPAEIGTGLEETRRGPGLELQIAFGLIQPLTEATLAEQDVLIDLAENIPLALFAERQNYAPMLTVNDEASRVTFGTDPAGRSIFIAEWFISYFDVLEK